LVYFDILVSFGKYKNNSNSVKRNRRWVKNISVPLDYNNKINGHN